MWPAARNHDGPHRGRARALDGPHRGRARALFVAIGAVLLPSLLCAQYDYPDEQSPEEPELIQSSARRGFLRSPDQPFSQQWRSFLNRGVWQGYNNYGRTPYETFTVTTKASEIYDRMGNRLLRGYPLISWQESRSKDPDFRESAIFRSGNYWQWFDNLYVFKESENGWNAGLVVGDKIRTGLTPLILQRPRWQGARLDVNSDRHGLTLLLTRGQQRRYSHFGTANEINPIPQFGGRWYSRLNETVTAGITFFNQHQADLRSEQGSLLQGTLGDGVEVPTSVFLRITDDSPDDNTQAQVDELHIVLTVVEEDGTQTIFTSEQPAPSGRVYDPRLRPEVTGGRPTASGRVVSGPDEAVEYQFTIPTVHAADRAHFEATVSGDYRISARQKHQYFNTSDKLKVPRWEERQWPAEPFVSRHNLGGRPQYPIDFKPDQSEPYYTLVRASGNSDIDVSREISFDYGIPVGQTLMGVDLEITSNELTARGELAYNWQQYQFPFNSDSLGIAGKHHGINALAGYLTLVGNLGPRAGDAQVGLEVFQLDADFSGGYESRRGGMVFFTDQDGDSETVRGKRTFRGFTQEFDLVADNDDGDDWPDDWPEDEGKFQPNQPQVYSGVQAHSGVFPGLDDDGDSSPDTDRNHNGIPDWTEPFLLYDAEPPDFVYGIDFNNNGIPDFRENDAQPDYPYRRDRKGYHAYVALPSPVALVTRLTVGRYSMRQIADGGRSRGSYARLKHRSHLRGGVEVEFDDDVKFVSDDIRDDVYVFDLTANGTNSGSVLTPPPPDPLDMRKSVVNTAFMRASAKPWRGLNLEAEALHFTNKQLKRKRGEETLQGEDVITRLSLIGKADYSLDWGRSSVWFGVKAMAREGNRDSLEDAEISERLFAPMVRVTYPFMTNLSLQLGLSGLRFLPLRYRDGVMEDNSFDQNTTVAMITSRADDYLGYALTSSAGVQWQRTDFDTRDKRLDSDTFGFFVETFAGF